MDGRVNRQAKGRPSASGLPPEKRRCRATCKATGKGRSRWLPQPAKFGDSYAWQQADLDRLRSLPVRRGRGPKDREKGRGHA